MRKWRREEPAEWQPPALAPKEGLQRYEFSLFSQNGEDGILRHLFNEIGFDSRFFFEFGFAPSQNNSLRLMLKEEFGGLFIDGCSYQIECFNEAVKRSSIDNVRAVCEFINVENIEDIIKRTGIPEEIDLLSIDVDGNDYWLWDTIDSISPRIVVIEYNSSFGPDLCVTVPYDPSFVRHEKHRSGLYYGASLTALDKLGTRKGYTLVGCDSNGVNAFFVRNDCVFPSLNRVTPQAAFRPNSHHLEYGFSEERQFEIVNSLPLEIIE